MGMLDEPIVKNGILVGYRVEKGQGPTQIAADINERAAAGEFSLSFTVDYLDIVNSNPDKFTNVVNKNNPFDVQFTKLNMNEGDILSVSSITDRETNILINTENAISYNNKLLYSFANQYAQNKKDIANSQNAVECLKEEAYSAARGRVSEFNNMPNVGYIISSNYALRQEIKKQNKLEIKKQNIIKSIDSVSSIIDSLVKSVK